LTVLQLAVPVMAVGPIEPDPHHLFFHSSRTWRLTENTPYAFVWRSDQGDVLVARFEQYPLLNGQALPEYQEDGDAILSQNQAVNGAILKPMPSA